MEDYDFTLQYHPRKANVVADALRRKTLGIQAYLALEDWKQSEIVGNYDLQYYEDSNQAMVYNLVSTPTLIQQVKQNQWQDSHLQGIWTRVQNGEKQDEWNIREDGTLYFRNCLAVPQVDEIKKTILHEAHKSRFAIHPGSTKMYQDLKR
ncbi:uncharacterized protein LOC112094279 [Morus notabilis]|uniref:uncharacterized protein LOC112094279 n=1 Tax=Morus notabilis TaxID=981085 RepID=UPI000CED0FCB|nr:uncharacterized protein LOC112094279 [Morus notabilis]